MAVEQQPERLLTRQETASLLRVHPRTLQRRDWRQATGLPAVRIGGKFMFRAQDVAAAIERGRESGS